MTISCENKIYIIIHFSFPRIGVIDCIRLDVRIKSTVLGTFISSNVNMFQHVQWGVYFFAAKKCLYLEYKLNRLKVSKRLVFIVTPLKHLTSLIQNFFVIQNFF